MLITRSNINIAGKNFLSVPGDAGSHCRRLIDIPGKGVTESRRQMLRNDHRRRSCGKPAATSLIASVPPVEAPRAISFGRLAGLECTGLLPAAALSVKVGGLFCLRISES